MGINQTLLTVYDSLDKKISLLRSQVDTFKTVRGEKGAKGDTGLNGKDGKSGVNGTNGKDGKNGKDGRDGEDGISVVNAEVDIDGHLTVTLSDNSIIDAGSLNEFGKSVAEATLIKSSTVVREAVQYIPQAEQTKRYYHSSFIQGINIIGVTFNGNSIVEIPETLESNKLIKVKDETGNNNIITINTWS